VTPAGRLPRRIRVTPRITPAELFFSPPFSSLSLFDFHRAPFVEPPFIERVDSWDASPGLSAASVAATG
jgi:hypothetical protein